MSFVWVKMTSGLYISQSEFHLLLPGHAHKTDGVLWVLVELAVRDHVGCILLAAPARGSEVTITVKFRVVKSVWLSSTSLLNLHNDSSFKRHLFG